MKGGAGTPSRGSPEGKGARAPSRRLCPSLPAPDPAWPPSPSCPFFGKMPGLELRAQGPPQPSPSPQGSPFQASEDPFSRHRTHRGTMRLPILMLLALLALLATVAGAEEGQETVRTHFQGLVQKAQEQIASFRASDVYQQMKELTQSCIERARNAIDQAKTHLSNLLQRNP